MAVIQGVEIANPNPTSLEIRSEMLPQIVPKRFWTVYADNPADVLNPIPEDWVCWAKKGDKGSECEERVDRVKKHLRAHWQVIEPFYRHWKTGQLPPETGTPLEKLPGMTPDLLDKCRQLHIRSIEDAAEMGEDAIYRIGFGARGVKDRAKAFLIKQPNIETDNRIEALEAKLAEAMKALEAANTPKKRGRKPKVQDAAE